MKGISSIQELCSRKNDIHKVTIRFDDNSEMPSTLTGTFVGILDHQIVFNCPNIEQIKRFKISVFGFTVYVLKENNNEFEQKNDIATNVTWYDKNGNEIHKENNTIYNESFENMEDYNDLDLEEDVNISGEKYESECREFLDELQEHETLEKHLEQNHKIKST